MWFTLQAERPLREMEGFVAAVHLHVEQRVLTTFHRAAQCVGRVGQQFGKIQPVQAAPLIEQVS